MRDRDSIAPAQAGAQGSLVPAAAGADAAQGAPGSIAEAVRAHAEGTPARTWSPTCSDGPFGHGSRVAPTTGARECAP
jgi:hypothetical protein